MSARPSVRSWGPSHQTGKRPDQGIGPKWFRRPIQALILLALFAGPRQAVVLLALLAGWLVVGLVVHLRNGRARERDRPTVKVRNGREPLAAVHAEAARLGGGTYLGVGSSRRWRLAGRERAVLLLGPPRSGKTQAVMIPALLAHAGPAVSASTKPDVLRATWAARLSLGEVWEFDPTGHASGAGGRVLRWSPVSASGSWDGALLMARAMVTGAGVGVGTSDGTHWSKRASALLAALLYAAAISDRGIDVVVDWVLTHELDQPGAVLQVNGARLACGVLTGLQNTEGRERSSICSAAADALDAYTSQAALTAASDPNFDSEAFVRSRDTVYVRAPAEHQGMAAPLVCGLLAEIRRATYHAHDQGELDRRVLFALDEVANIAPLAELPAIAAEGGGQGLALLAAFQDLSQARARWGPAADGFLTLFGSKLILPGVADPKTIEGISLALGEYDRTIISTSETRPGARLFGPGGHAQRGQTVSTQRQRVLSPGEIADIPRGHALHLDGVHWELLTTTPAYRTEPWRTLTEPAGSAK